MDERCPDARYQIVNQKSFWPPHVFKYVAEHPQREHVKNYVRQTIMHKHVGNKLVGAKFLGGKIVKTQFIGQIVTKCILQCHGHQKHQSIDD